MPSTENLIKDIRIEVKHFDLIAPYVLSFGIVSQIDSVQTEIILKNGRKTRAETVPLPGYSSETTETIVEYLNKVSGLLIDKKLPEARSIVEPDIRINSFACSPLLTAIDLFDYKIEPVDNKLINFVVPAASSNLKELDEVIKKLSRQNSNTVKIKLSGNINKDIECIKHLEKTDLSTLFIRFDANKAFKYENARIFYAALSKENYVERIHYVEQPLENTAWEEHAALVNEFSSVKTMLDESIVTMEDLRKAISIKIPFVKFKLFKQGGIKELIGQIETAHKNGLKIVLGNGVATLNSNEIENVVYNRYKNIIFGASEANGFKKIAS